MADKSICRYIMIFLSQFLHLSSILLKLNMAIGCKFSEYLVVSLMSGRIVINAIISKLKFKFFEIPDFKGEI